MLVSSLGNEPAPLECSELPFPVGHVRISLQANAIVLRLVRNWCRTRCFAVPACHCGILDNLVAAVGWP